MSDEKKDYFAPGHTAEHILNGTMVNMFGCKRSENCHVERKKSKCDFELQFPPTDDEVKTLEQKIREIISQNIDVIERIYSFEDAVKLFDLHRINKPENSTIRIISIGDYDHCPCIGKHVNNTSEIDDFRITSWNWENGVFRVRFKV
jgi:misacylated tRNA(Ala) deacylase